MDYLVITLIMLLGAFLQGLTGFGSGLIAVPLLAIYLPLTTITPTLSIINLLMATYLSWMLRRHVLWSQWKWLLCMGVLGTLLGNFLLAQVNLVGLQVGMALLVMAVALCFWFGVQWYFPNTPRLQLMTGVLAGFSNGALTLGGPPVVLFLTSQRMSRNSFRATLAAFFWVLALTNVLSFTAQQRYNIEHVPLLLALVTGTLLGTWLGHRLSHHLSEQLFRRITLGLVFAAGLMALYSTWQAT